MNPIVFLLLLCLLIHSSAGFVPNARSLSQRTVPSAHTFVRNGSSNRRPKTRHLALWSSKQDDSYYSDDCFGLIFLCGAVVVQDPVFAGIFLILSSVGAILTQLGRLQANKQIPGAVAGFTLLLTPVATTLLQKMGILPNPIATNAPIWLEAAVCTFSLFYSFVWQKEMSDEES